MRIMAMGVDEISVKPQDINTIFEGIESKRTKFSNKIFRADQVQISSTKYLIKNWFGYEGLSLVYGSSGVGKTLLALDLGFHVASSVDWFGNRVNGGNVVYIMSEEINVSNNRIKAIETKKLLQFIESFFLIT